MNKKYCISILVAALAFIVGCHAPSQRHLLSEAESFLPSCPDSADARLSTVSVHLLRDEAEKAHYALLRVMTDAILGEISHNDTLVRRAYHFYLHQSLSGQSSDNISVKHFAQSALYMGDWYIEHDSVKLGEDCFRQAIASSEKIQDWRMCYLSYARLAEQVQWSDEKEALKLIEKAIEAYDRIKDNASNLVYLLEYAEHYSSQIAYRYDENQYYQQALEYASKAYHLASDSCAMELCNETLVTLADIYWAMGEYSSALDYVRNITIKSLDSEYSQRMNLKIAQYFLSCDSLSKARELFLAPSKIEDMKLRYHYERALAELSIKQKMPGDTILFYTNKAFTSHENVHLDALRAKYDYYQEVLQIEKANEQLLFKNKLRTWIFLGTILLIVITALLVVWLLVVRIRLYRERRKNAVKLRKYELERSIEERRRSAYELQLLREREQALADGHQKKIATIKHLQNYIIGRTDVTMKLMNESTYVNMTPKEWYDIESLLDEIDNKCISKIRTLHKNISADDIRLCIMVRLGMSNPAIGAIYGITPSAVQHRKQTLKKKVFGVLDPHLSLSDVIKSL